MNTNFDSVQTLLLTILFLSVLVAAVAIAYKKKLLVSWGKVLEHDPDPDLPLRQSYYTKAAADLLPPLIDRPSPIQDEPEYFETGDDDVRYELVDDEDLNLLKTAEAIVSDIQNVVNHIASHPANPDEVCSKIHFVLRDLGIIRPTEYFEAINSFIAVTVKRDCDLELTRDDIEALWMAEAA